MIWKKIVYGNAELYNVLGICLDEYMNFWFSQIKKMSSKYNCNNLMLGRYNYSSPWFEKEKLANTTLKDDEKSAAIPPMSPLKGDEEQKSDDETHTIIW